MKRIFITLAILFLIYSTSNAQSQVVPIIEMKVGALLGGVQNGKYLNAKTTIKKLSAEQKYTLYFLGSKSETLKLRKPLSDDQEFDECPEINYIHLVPGKSGDASYTDAEREESNKRWKKGGVGLGSSFNWNPQPREIKSINLNNAKYKKIVADFLLTKKIRKHEVKLKQAFRVDLEGDGIEEVLLVASRQTSYSSDDYSVVLLRKVINGKPQTILVEGYFYRKNVQESDVYDLELSSILDLNGDGKLELVIFRDYLSATYVFGMVGNKAVEIKTLTAECEAYP